MSYDWKLSFFFHSHLHLFLLCAKRLFCYECSNYTILMKPFAGSKLPSLYRLYLTNRGRRAVLEQRLMFEATALSDDSMLHRQQVK